MLISVIIPTYNRAALLPRALDSVLAQSGIPLEIIVVDDASTDGTAEAVKGWCQVSGIQPSPRLRPASRSQRSEVGGQESGGRSQDSRLTTQHSAFSVPHTSLLLVTLPSNSGPAAARNRGLAEAKGDYVAFLDSDDEWLPGSLSLRVEALRRHDDVDLLFCDFEDREDGRTALASFLHTRDVWPQFRFVRGDDGVCLPENFFDCQLIQPLVQTSTVLIRRQALNAGDVLDERLRLAEDWEFWLRVSRHHKVGFLDQVLVRRHLQGDNLTQDPSGWLEAKIAAGEIILEEYEISVSQKLFLRQRLAEDCFDLGYHLCRQVGDLKNARRRLAASLLYYPSGKALKCLAYTALAGAWEHRVS